MCAVSEARGISPSVGIAFINVTLGEVTLSQICDNQLYYKTIHKIQLASPSRIIFTHAACPPNQPSALYSRLQESMPEIQVDSFERSAWSETVGLEYIRDLGIESDFEPIKVALEGKYYAVSSFSAVSLL